MVEIDKQEFTTGINIMRLSVLGILSLGIFMLLLPTRSHAEPTIMEPITQDMLEKMVFGDRPEGCKSRFDLFTVGLFGYREGQAVEELAEMKIIQPFIQKVYDKIRAEGVSKAIVSNMMDFQSCAEKFEAAGEIAPVAVTVEDGLPPIKETQEEMDERTERVAKRSAFFHSCGALNAIALTAIDGVEKKKEQAEVEAMVVPIDMDVTGTVFEHAENPQKMIVSKIYGAGSYDDAVNVGYGLVINCFGTK